MSCTAYPRRWSDVARFPDIVCLVACGMFAYDMGAPSSIPICDALSNYSGLYTGKARQNQPDQQGFLVGLVVSMLAFDPRLIFGHSALSNDDSESYASDLLTFDGECHHRFLHILTWCTCLTINLLSITTCVGECTIGTRSGCGRSLETVMTSKTEECWRFGADVSSWAVVSWLTFSCEQDNENIY
jgi:hypothetical protein